MEKKAGARRAASKRHRSSSPPAIQVKHEAASETVKEEPRDPETSKEESASEAGDAEIQKGEPEKKKRRKAAPSPPRPWSPRSQRNSPPLSTSPNRKKIKIQRARTNKAAAQAAKTSPPEKAATAPASAAAAAPASMAAAATAPTSAAAAAVSRTKAPKVNSKKKGKTSKKLRRLKRHTEHRVSAAFRRLQRRYHVQDIPVNSIVAEGHAGNITFVVRKVLDQRFKKLMVDRANFDVKFGLMDKDKKKEDRSQLLIHSLEALEQALRMLHDHLREEYKDVENAGVQFAVMSDALEKGSINRPIQRLDDPLAVDDLLGHLEKVLQSNKSLVIDDTLKVSVIINRVPPLKSAKEQRLRSPKKQMKIGANDDNVGSGSDSGWSGSNSVGSESDSNCSGDASAQKKRKKKRRKARGKRGNRSKKQMSTKRIALGPTFRDPEWTSEGNSLLVVPEFASGPLVNCCLLVAMVMGLAFCKELDANKGRKTMSKTPLTEGWKKLQALNWEEGSKSRQARRYLEEEVLLLADRFQFPPDEFCLVDPEDVRERIRQLPLNLRIYDAAKNHDIVFQEPYEINPDYPTVNVLKTTNPVNQLEHCGLIKRPDLYFSSIGRQRCPDCSKSFIKR